MGHVVEVCLPRVLSRCFIALCILAAFAEPVANAADTSGEDVLERYKVIEKDLKAHKKAKELRKLREDIKSLEKLYVDAEHDDDVRVKIVNLVGSLTKAKRNEQMVIMGLHGLGDLGDPRGAKFVRAKLRQPNVKQASNTLEAAVATAADVVHPSLVAPLLKIVCKSKTLGVAADAIQSLGRYGRCEKKRVRILTTIVDSVRKDRTGGVAGGGGSGGARGGSGGTSTNPEQGPLPPARAGSTSNRWGTLSRVLPGAMNELTGQDIGTADEWIDLVRDSRGSLGDIFQLPEETTGK